MQIRTSLASTVFAITVAGVLAVIAINAPDALRAAQWAAGFFLAASAILLALLLRVNRRQAGSDRTLRRVLERIPAGIVIFDVNRCMRHCNNYYAGMYGLDPSQLREDMHESSLRTLRNAAGLPVTGSQSRRTVRYDCGRAEYFVENWTLADGRYIRMSQVPLAGGGFIAIHQDITEQKQNRMALKQSQQFLNAIFDSVPAAILVKDAKTLTYTMVNQEAEKIIGIEKSRIIGATSEQIYNLDEAARIRKRDEVAIASHDPAIVAPEHIYRLPDGRTQIHRSRRCVIRNDNGEPTHLLTVLEDLTAQRKAEESIHFLAMHDALTQLNNRAWFNENLPVMLKALSGDEHLAVVLLDLDHFKQVNDLCGHLAGDHVLRTVAARINAHLGERDRAVRLGGDEFAILIVVDDPLEELEQKLHVMLADLRKPVEFEGRVMECGVSAGYSIAVNAAVDRDILFGQADLALYEAKAGDKEKIRSFNLSMMKGRLRAKALARHMREAVDCDSFEVHYQPIVDACSQEIRSMEALIRWNHPEYGMVRPDEFIPIAEETGLIVPIGERVLQKACNAAVKFPAHIGVSVNLSPLQFRDPALLKKVENALLMSGLDASRLELELTEAALLRNEAENLSILNALRAKNVRIAMDDFGTGYSSLNYLRKFPFDKIKIDKSYVDGLWRDGDSSGPILQAVIALAAELHLATTAEGVEHQEQVAFLRAEGCSELQGYFFSKPLPLGEALELFEEPAGSTYKVA